MEPSSEGLAFRVSIWADPKIGVPFWYPSELGAVLYFKAGGRPYIREYLTHMVDTWDSKGLLFRYSNAQVDSINIWTLWVH